MKLEKFMEAVTIKVQEIAGEDASVHVQEVRKNNNVLLHGMTILRKGQNVSPTIYLDSFFEMLEDGMDLEYIVRRILEVYVKGLPKSKVDMEFFRDFEKVKDRIVYRLVNREKNKELLDNIPHVDFLDLAICFYYSYEHSELGEGMILIHNNQSPFTGAIVVPNRDALRRELAARGIADDRRAAAAAELLGAEIDRYRAGGSFAGEFPERWLPAGLAIVAEPFTEQNGLVNSTMKVVRGKVEEHFRDRLEYLYMPEGRRLQNAENLAALKKIVG